MSIDTIGRSRGAGLAIALLAALALAGCRQETPASAAVTSATQATAAVTATGAASSGTTTGSTPAPTPLGSTSPVSGSVQASTSGAPAISGAPPTAARVGVAWSFQPTAIDPNGDALSFSVANKPAWMSFETSTGRLAGTPGAGDLGSFGNITVSVSDGSTTASLAPFAVLVSPSSTTGSATLSWTPPTSNTDGSPLTNLAGYRIYYGNSPTALGSSVQITNAGLTSYTLANLGPGTYYFAIAAYTSDGIEGDRSSVGSKTIL